MLIIPVVVAEESSGRARRDAISVVVKHFEAAGLAHSARRSLTAANRVDLIVSTYIIFWQLGLEILCALACPPCLVPVAKLVRVRSRKPNVSGAAGVCVVVNSRRRGTKFHSETFVVTRQPAVPVVICRRVNASAVDAIVDFVTK
jgi:hypothetical protein